MKSANYYLLAVLLVCAQCRHVGPVEKSFDQISVMVDGRTAAEVEDLLGPPNTRQPVLFGDERWIWWSYTYLDGKDYAPQVRGRIVNLEILFRNPTPSGKPRLPYSQWRIVSPYGVSYSGLLPERRIVPAKQSPSGGVSLPETSERIPAHESGPRPLPEAGPADRDQQLPDFRSAGAARGLHP